MAVVEGERKVRFLTNELSPFASIFYPLNASRLAGAVVKPTQNGSSLREHLNVAQGPFCPLALEAPDKGAIVPANPEPKAPSVIKLQHAPERPLLDVPHTR